MSIFDKIWEALKEAFPFLSKAAERTFNDLEDAAKNAGINGSFFAQIIKENTSAAYDDVRNLVKAKLKLSDAQLTDLEEQLVVKYNIPTEKNVYEFLQGKFANATDDILHSSLANEVASLASIILSKGKLTWVTLLMGVGEYVYRKYVKGHDVVIAEGGGDPTKCPAGYAWNGSKCVPDVG